MKKEHEIIDLLMRGNLPRRPLKEWERREIFSKIGRLRASAVEKEDYAMRTTSDRMARRAEEDARELRKKADVLEKNAAKLGIKKSRPTMENKQMKITRRQLRQIIKETWASYGVDPVHFLIDYFQAKDELYGTEEVIMLLKNEGWGEDEIDSILNDTRLDDYYEERDDAWGISEVPYAGPGDGSLMRGLTSFVEGRMHEAVELNQRPDRAAISNAWPQGVTLDGRNVFDTVYSDSAMNKQSDFVTGQGYDGQETYLGYDPQSGNFVMGFDAFYDEDGMGAGMEGFFFTVSPSGNPISVVSSEPGGVYPRGLKTIKKRFPQLIDVRLD